MLNSASVVDEETAKQDKKLAAKKDRYHADKLVIDTIIEIISSESLDLTEPIACVSEETGESRAQCKKVVDRHKGEGLDDYSFWRVQTSAHKRKALELLILGV